MLLRMQLLLEFPSGRSQFVAERIHLAGKCSFTILRGTPLLFDGGLCLPEFSLNVGIVSLQISHLIRAIHQVPIFAFAQSDMLFTAHSMAFQKIEPLRVSRNCRVKVRQH
ncbi:hypothetical protein AGMMS50256_31530 [Betaproteobacteria bacterium]|nr:hypothetical protein AGMMS50256_31530 [Betaproteobacteria bacterium]